MPSALARVLARLSLPVAIGVGAGSLLSGGVGYAAGLSQAGTVTRPTSSPTTLTQYLTMPAETVTETETETATETVGVDGEPVNVIDVDGTYEVGVDIEPGTYKSAGGVGSVPRCYWARLSSFDESDIIANHLAEGPTTVTIKRGDVAFKTARCAPWVRTR